MEETIYLLRQPKYPYQDFYFSFCGFSRTEPMHSFGPAIRDTYLFHIILEGKGYYSIKNQKYYLGKGQGFVIPPNVSTFYQADNTEPWSYVWMGIGGEMMEQYMKQLGINSEHLSFNVQNLNDFKANVFQCFAYEQDDFKNDIILQKQAYSFVELLTKSHSLHEQEVKTKKMNPYVNQALEIINQHVKKDLSVVSIAKELSINSSYLSRLFKADIGISIKEYINEIRLTKGNDLLALTDYTIHQISEMIGFSSPQAFSKAFKQSSGISPVAYRKKRIGLRQERL